MFPRRAGDHSEKMDAATAKKEADQAKKTSVKVGPWDVCKKVLVFPIIGRTCIPILYKFSFKDVRLAMLFCIYSKFDPESRVLEFVVSFISVVIPI